MAKSRKEKDAGTQLRALAKQYGVAHNPLVLELIGKYDSQKKRLTKMLDELDEAGLTCTKEYVKGRENISSHPLIDSCQKLEDSMGRTSADLTDAIIRFGTTPPRKDSKLAALDDDA